MSHGFSADRHLCKLLLVVQVLWWLGIFLLDRLGGGGLGTALCFVAGLLVLVPVMLGTAIWQLLRTGSAWNKLFELFAATLGIGSTVLLILFLVFEQSFVISGNR